MESFLFEALRDNKSSGMIGRKIGIDLYLDPLHGLATGTRKIGVRSGPIYHRVDAHAHRKYPPFLLASLFNSLISGNNKVASRWNEPILATLGPLPSFISFLLGWGRIEETVLILALKSSRSIVRQEWRAPILESRSVDFRGKVTRRGSINIFARRKKIADERRVARSLVPQPQDIIGSNASRQTIREISYRLVAALAPLVTAYSWNALASLYRPVHDSRCISGEEIEGKLV